MYTFVLTSASISAIRLVPMQQYLNIYILVPKTNEIIWISANE